MPEVWDLDLVNEWVENVALTPIGKFYPTAVAKDTELHIQDVFSRLLDLVKDNKLQIIWEVRCPNCFLTLGQLETRDVLHRTLFCYECADDIEITPDMVFPAFRIAPGYKAHIQRKKKQQACRKVLGRFSRQQDARCLI